jgi:hypothetical protein
MTDDLVTRLRRVPNFNDGKLAHEAADEIERLQKDRAAVEELVDALKVARYYVATEMHEGHEDLLKIDAALAAFDQEAKG